MRPKRSDWIVPFVVAGLGASAVFLFAGLGPAPIEGSVVPGSVTDLGNDFVEVEVSFVPSPEQGTMQATVDVHAVEIEDGVVPIWLLGEDPTAVDPRFHPELGDYFLGTMVGLLLGIVMVMTVRGYGYVRGDGEPGSQPHVPVGEEEGFYWRY